MAKLSLREKVKLFVGLLSAKEYFFEKVKDPLEEKLGKIEEESDTFPFEHTHYYDEELGRPIRRKFFVFEPFFEIEGLHRVKLFTNSLEEKFSFEGKRLINIDPGYICLSKVVLFTKKDWSHRIYIGDGVYAEATLYFREKSFHPFPWTYPDYKTAEYISFFNKVRSSYKEKIKGLKTDLKLCSSSI